MVYGDDSYDRDVRDRLYGTATRSSEGRHNFLVVTLAVALFILIVSVSCRQATAPGQARNVLEAGLVTLTDIDQLLADEGPAIRQAAQDSEDEHVILPGYPLDIVLTKEEVVSSTNEQLRDIILERSSALIYAEGIGAFDRTGEQDLRTFSIQGVLEYGVEQVSEDTYDRATLIAIVSLAASALAAAIVAATTSGWGRMRAVGFAAIAAGIPVVVGFFLLRLMVDQIGGDDPFISASREIADAALGVPLRNGLIVLGAGIVVVALSVALAGVERMTSRQQAAWDEEW